MTLSNMEFVGCGMVPAAFDLANVGYLGNVSNVFTSLIKVVHMTCTVLEGSGGFSHVD